ncbi:uncharacterized protein LOC131690700 [Topomyia yanbarensis]|uniref:uncharacterized protein LOC131690700 n=1 Tax=Topomyia yanbarensis TaxID=2498891 RepID=UPI00273C9CC9|nr:uncharacterized protein LOC131690700 [Topomyia yanbarensis]
MMLTRNFVAILRFSLLVKFINGASIVVLVANGSDITINLPAENNNNRLLSVISDSGNNNPSIFDWIGGNGANKAPHVSVGGVNQQHSAGQGTNETSALLKALLKGENSPANSTDEPNDAISDESEEKSSFIGEQRIDATTEVAEAFTEINVQVTVGRALGTTLEANNETWKRKYVTVEMKNTN